MRSASLGSRRLEHPTAALFEGWDKTSRQHDARRRVAVVCEDFVVVVAMSLKKDGSLKANLVTCYRADNSIGKIGARRHGHGQRASACWEVSVMAAQKNKRPLICYAGSAAETSIGSKPIGSELSGKVYPERPVCRCWLCQTRAYSFDLRHAAEGMTQEQNR